MNGKTWKRLLAIVAGLLALGFGSLAGCGKSSHLEGHWVDVNGETTLDFRGNELTVTFGKWTETYRFRVETGEGVTYLENAGDKTDRSFGAMSALQVGDDGALTAHEMILDDEGHYYRFVRPEALEKELAIQDLSKDAPKTIDSRDVEQFSLSFRNYGGSYGLSRRWPAGSYSWEIKRKDGGWQMEFRVMGPSYIAMDYTGTVSAAYVAGLAQRIEELGIPRYNGYYKKNNVHRPGYSLTVKYASKERLRVAAEGSAAESCVFDIPALLDYADQQPLPPPF